ncbi:hypothetical protein M0811_14576 [Anaeramoeba ignava]|uniref:Uncharacterized protein n=1 Tax=Anaeramoeba ignava TaxID=1746090 RepID=A0A9Q0LU92_ANAIG|nr:hypothetical protein M0811_14576 [Anaeramoeba ignava]
MTIFVKNSQQNPFKLKVLEGEVVYDYQIDFTTNFVKEGKDTTIIVQKKKLKESPKFEETNEKQELITKLEKQQKQQKKKEVKCGCYKKKQKFKLQHFITSVHLLIQIDTKIHFDSNQNFLIKEGLFEYSGLLNGEIYPVFRIKNAQGSVRFHHKEKLRFMDLSLSFSEVILDRRDSLLKQLGQEILDFEKIEENENEIEKQNKVVVWGTIPITNID